MDDIFVSFNVNCEWCHRKVSNSYIHTEDYQKHFCNIVCAKLYMDNVSHIDIDYIDYINAVVNNSLDKKYKSLYKKTKNLMLEQLPVMQVTIHVNREEASERYLEILQKIY
jgi:hypothetical protein